MVLNQILTWLWSYELKLDSLRLSQARAKSHVQDNVASRFQGSDSEGSKSIQGRVTQLRAEADRLQAATTTENKSTNVENYTPSRCTPREASLST